MTAVPEIAAGAITGPDQFLQDVVLPCQPLILRGLVADWPVARAADARAFRALLAPLDAGHETEAFFGAPQIAGKYFYAEDLKGFNFQRRRMALSAALDLLVGTIGKPGGESIYIGSLPTNTYLPGFGAANPMPLLPGVEPRLWLGHASTVSFHYDTADNLACVAAGKRRFTLYAPELIDSLYVGPIDNTMAGQPVSLAASAPRDDAKYPKFAGIRDQALVAELAAGDALYLPKLWWHQVESIAPFNALVNYWWDAFAAGPDAPYTTLLLAMIAIAERPAPERRAWKALFDHYVFRQNGHPLAHLPPDHHGILGPLKENYGKIRARVMFLLRGGA